jgi:hypothetical protein
VIDAGGPVPEPGAVAVDAGGGVATENRFQA